MGRRVERQARENSVLCRKCEAQESEIVRWSRKKVRGEGGGVGKGQIQLLPCLEPSNSFLVTSGKSSCSSIMGVGWGRGPSSSDPSLRFIFPFFPPLHSCHPVVPCLHQLFPLLFPMSGKTPQLGRERSRAPLMACHDSLGLPPTEAHATVCCNE